MFNVCPKCGMYSVEKKIDPSGPFAICPYCSHPHRFVRLPLFILTGASGTGKTTIALELVKFTSRVIVLESDILWRPEFNRPEDNYHEYRDLWLRLAKNIGQAGRPVLLCGSVVPEQFESCPESRYFTCLYHLAVVCEEPVLADRLRNRPEWRGSAQPEFVERMLAFNRWFYENASRLEPPIELLDTTYSSVAESAAAVDRWVLACLAER